MGRIGAMINTQFGLTWVRIGLAVMLASAVMLAAGSGLAQPVGPMYGGTLIDGYDFGKDTGPKGSLAFNKETGEFKGSYTGLKMPPGRRAIFAWLHDTVNQRSELIGPVGWLKKGTGGKNKGRFTIKVPGKYRNGQFGDFEILAFTAEKTGFLNGKKVVQYPTEPSGSNIQKELKPAFYLFGALPGADTETHYCGHGQDFFIVKAPGKQTCYD